MTITCQVCGTANPDGTTYCEGCGVELTASATPAAAAPAPEAAAAPVAETPAAPVETPPLEDVATPAAAPVTALTPPEGWTPPAASGEPVVADSATTPAEATAPAPEAPAEETPATPEPEAAPVVAAAPAAPASTGEAKLGIKKFGVNTGDFIPLQGEKLVVGRFDASTGPVDVDLSGLTGQEHISRRHAELYRENGVWHVRDLGSTNGVYVKHKGESAFSPRLQEPAALSDGDEIAFGNLMMTFNQG